jgi:hypothetical protein
MYISKNEARPCCSDNQSLQSVISCKERGISCSQCTPGAGGRHSTISFASKLG